MCHAHILSKRVDIALNPQQTMRATFNLTKKDENDEDQNVGHIRIWLAPKINDDADADADGHKRSAPDDDDDEDEGEPRPKVKRNKID
jgi:hypothetical protein